MMVLNKAAGGARMAWRLEEDFKNGGNSGSIIYSSSICKCVE